MNIFSDIRFAVTEGKLIDTLKENKPMQVKIPQLVHLVCTLVGIASLPLVISQHLSTGMLVFQILVGISTVAHTLCPSIFGGPSDAAKQATGITGAIILLALLALVAPHSAMAQTAPTTDAYVFGGVAYSPNGAPAVTGAGGFATGVIPSTGTYSFTLCQAVPNSKPTFTVVTNCGTGVLQKVPFSIGPVTPVVTTTAGISWSQSNVGFGFNSMVGFPIPIKKSKWAVVPYVGYQKSSVSNGTGYQLAAGSMVSYHFQF